MVQVCIVNINRYDASGFCLDILATHKQFAVPAVCAFDLLTTHTDYVNRYSSVLCKQLLTNLLVHP